MMAGCELAAVLWDVDGTIAETERDGHRVAFNLAFDALGLPWRWDSERYGALLRVSGGLERLLHYMEHLPDAPRGTEERTALARSLHAAKNALYAELIRDTGIPMRDGVFDLMSECRNQNVRMAIATTTSRPNVEVLMGKHLGGRWADWFGAVVCGEDVVRKKPDGEVFEKTLQLLGVEAQRVIAIEDSPNGVAAASAARCAVIVTRSAYFAEVPINGALAIGPGLHTRADWSPALRQQDTTRRVCLADMINWFTQWQQSDELTVADPERCPASGNSAHMTRS